MDRVRFGRALGMGARQAAKVLVEAVEAAAAPDPAGRGRVAGKVAEARQAAARTTAQVVETQRGVARGSRRLGEALWTPLVKVSGVLWLEVTGVFFGLFLLVAAMNTWKLRGAWRDMGANHLEHVHLLWSVGMTAVFGYFCVSSFLRARMRSRAGR